MIIWVDKNTTWCPDTPDNWRRFEELKAGLRSGRRRSGNLAEKLKAMTDWENKQLKSLRRYLPGHEPDK